MCGLCGYISREKATDKHLAIFRGLLIANQERGEDSTGCAFIGKKTLLQKDTKSAIEFTKEIKTSPEHFIALGHTRFATTGKVTKRNAHPFKRGKIIGCHNGIVNNYLEIDTKVEVDSEVIFDLLSKENNNYKKVFKKLSGNFALTWHTKDDSDAVYFVVNGNPLNLVYIKPLKSFFWSSEYLHLLSVLLSHYKSKEMEMYSFENDTVYRIDRFANISKRKVSFKKYPASAINYTNILNKDAIKFDNDDLSYSVASCVYDTDFRRKNSLADAVIDICFNEGCSLCTKIIEDEFCYITEDGFVTCKECNLLYKLRSDKFLIYQGKFSN